MVAFNSKANTWQNRMVEVTEQSLIGAWKWIQNLSCWGSTNTYAAIQHALTDPGTQAIYLLTDGRPDQVHDNTSTLFDSPKCGVKQQSLNISCY
jgi:hypothetical protein